MPTARAQIALPRFNIHKLDECQVILRELAVARRDPPTSFELIEEPFDQVGRLARDAR